jgi:hypothetical protein
MVRAILAGRKTQTRRVVKGHWLPLVEEVMKANGRWVFETTSHELTTPYGKPGDRLWVREAWHTDTVDLEAARAQHEDLMSPSPIFYRAEAGIRWPHAGWKWRPSIHMPRWASRITLEVTGVRVERAQEITWADIHAEGVECPTHDFPGGFCCGPCTDMRSAWATLWDSINAKRGYGWEKNPWIWVVEFKSAT